MVKILYKYCTMNIIFGQQTANEIFYIFGLTWELLNYAESINCSLMFCLLVGVSSLSRGTNGSE